MRDLALGLMSGTSADGVSVAAVRPRPFKVLACRTYPYEAALRRRILRARNASVQELSLLNFELGMVFARAARRFCREEKLPLSCLAAVGSHGQTVLHDPRGKIPNTLQIGEASFLAEALGAPVVSDFRPRDMAAGGQGAPLVPFLDEYLYGRGKPVLLQNIGGIGNISVVGRGVRTFGFDTGPGNCLLDAAVRQATAGRMEFDRDGRIASYGLPDRALVAKLLGQAYFKTPPPKSLDRAQFGEEFLARHFGVVTPSRLPDVLATLVLFTAQSIALAARRFILPRCKADTMLVSGGGALNPALMAALRAGLPETQVLRSSEAGMPELAKEPACFALMAWLGLNRKKNHCPRATGASGARILGKVSY